VFVAVGVEVQVKAPEEFVTPLVAKQKYIAVEAPFAVTEPFNGAVVALMDVGSLVVAIGGPAAIVNVKFLVAVTLSESVTLNVSAAAVTAAVGVPEITPVVVFRVSPAAKLPEVNAHEL